MSELLPVPVGYTEAECELPESHNMLKWIVIVILPFLERILIHYCIHARYFGFLHLPSSILTLLRFHDGFITLFTENPPVLLLHCQIYTDKVN